MRNLNFNGKFNRLAVQRKNKFYCRQNTNGFKNYVCKYCQDSMPHLATCDKKDTARAVKIPIEHRLVADQADAIFCCIICNIFLPL